MSEEAEAIIKLLRERLAQGYTVPANWSLVDEIDLLIEEIEDGTHIERYMS